MKPLPRTPIFGWSVLRESGSDSISDLDRLAYQVETTSGRAAIYHALKLLHLPPQSEVLLPTYHCPTMVAPALLANLRPTFYGIGEDGLPDLGSLERECGTRARALVVPHLFGRTQSLAAVRHWCDAHRIALIEDCAHALFGQAGERPVGAWGDFATASLSKFLPVSEGGVLASGSRPMPSLLLKRRRLHDEIKGWIDVAELSAQYRKVPGLNGVLTAGFSAKAALRGRRWPAETDTVEVALQERSVSEMLTDCDMARIGEAPLSVTSWMRRHVSYERIRVQRRRNFDLYAECFSASHDARALCGAVGGGVIWPEAEAPYVFPLWVDDADAVYASVRQARLPVFRWDRLWPGTPNLPGDHGKRWSHHVLQLLCHQDLQPQDIEMVSHAILRILAGSRGHKP